jgi:hypothetical protein
MKLNDLIQSLLEMQAQYGEDSDIEVRLMTQQSWPFENAICGVTSNEAMDGASECEECGRFKDACRCEKEEGSDLDENGEKAPVVVYLVEGEQIGYGRKDAWSCCI